MSMTGISMLFSSLLVFCLVSLLWFYFFGLYLEDLGTETRRATEAIIWNLLLGEIRCGSNEQVFENWSYCMDLILGAWLHRPPAKVTISISQTWPRARSVLHVWPPNVQRSARMNDHGESVCPMIANYKTTWHGCSWQWHLLHFVCALVEANIAALF
jgi:hypothetical protein